MSKKAFLLLGFAITACLLPWSFLKVPDAKLEQFQVLATAPTSERKVCSSPADTFKTFIDAEQEGDWVTVFACLSPDQQNERLLGIITGALLMNDDTFVNRFVNEAILEDQQSKVGDATYEERIKAVGASIVERERMFVDGMSVPRIRNGIPEFFNLRNVVIDGAQATGICSSKYVESTFDLDISFIRRKGKWLIHRVVARDPMAKSLTDHTAPTD